MMKNKIILVLLLLLYVELNYSYLLYNRKYRIINNNIKYNFKIHSSDNNHNIETTTTTASNNKINNAELEFKKLRTSIPYRVGSSSDMFCNRELNMEQIMAIGFDMDYTLAQYKVEFDLLAYNGAKEKLVYWLGYPSEVLDFEYQQDITRRGCMIDTIRGNILQLDQHKYVRAVEHGLTSLSREERKSIYRGSFQEAEKFTGKDFSNIDTPFSLVDACLFAQLVDIKDRNSMKGIGGLLAKKSYLELWKDMRRCVDRCHKDGVIKDTVAKDPEKYIIFDDKIFPMLGQFRARGLKVFLLTNSLWDYTQVVMNYLQGKKTKKDNNLDLDWTNYFDLVIVGGNKPAFLLDERSLSIYQINSTSGTLKNVEALPDPSADRITSFLHKHGKIFQGGNAQILHRLLSLPSGDRLLYVGDHIFSDVVRSKRSLNWRTCLIVPELVEEVKVYRKTRQLRNELLLLRRKAYLLEDRLNELQVSYLRNNSNESATMEPGEQGSIVEGLLSELEMLRLQVREKLSEYDQHFHPRWGQLFKAGFQDSMISKQIQDFACIYTSKASNLGLVSPLRHFRPGRDYMAHDHIVDGL